MIQSFTNNITLTNGIDTQVVTKALLELESNTSLNKALLAQIKSAFFEKKPINWKPVKCELIVNTKLTEEFKQIKGEFEENPEAEADEKYGFIVDSDAVINEIAQNGYSCPENSYNVIGQSKSGVYLCKYPDVDLKFSESKKYPDNLTLKMIIFKICYGKQTLALVRKDSKLPPIVATPNFNSHMSVIPPKEKDDIDTQFDHSQIYLYELNTHKQAIKRPRHCMPYAVVTWLKFNDGTEWPQYFESDADVSILTTDSLQLALKTTEDIYLQTKLKSLLKMTRHDGQNGDSQLINGNHPIQNGVVNGMNASPEVNGTNGTNGETNGVNGTNGTDKNEIKTDETPNESLENTTRTEENKSEASKEQEINGFTNGEVTTPTVAVKEVTEPTEKTEEEPQSKPDEQQQENKLPISNETTLLKTENTEAVTKPVENSETSAPPSTQATTPVPATTPLGEAAQAQGAAKAPTPTSAAAVAAALQRSAVSSSPVATGYHGHKTTISHFNKPAYSSMYRGHNPAGGIPSYLLAAQAQAQGLGQFHPYAGIPYHQRQLQQNIIPNQLGLAGMSQGGQLAGQGQMYLVRGPNGVSYVSAGMPQQAQYGAQQQQQMLLAQAQAQALQLQQLQQQQQQQQQQHHQNLAASQAAVYAQQLALQQAQASYTAAPTNYKQGVPQQQSQIIYQSAPQPAQPPGQSTAKPATVTQNAGTAAPAPPPTQSPKQPNQQQHVAAQYAAAQYASQQQQQQAAAAAAAAAQGTPATAPTTQQPSQSLYTTQHQIGQINQMQQMQAALNGQQNYLAYAPAGSQASTNPGASANPNSQATSASQQNFLLQQQQQQGQSTPAGQQQLQLQQQLALIQQQQQIQANQQPGQASAATATNPQLLAYQQQLSGSAGLNIPQQNFSSAQAMQLQGGAGVQIPPGYQLVDYRGLQGAQGGLSLEQLAGLGGAVPRPRIVNLRHHPYQRN